METKGNMMIIRIKCIKVKCCIYYVKKCYNIKKEKGDLQLYNSLSNFKQALFYY